MYVRLVWFGLFLCLWIEDYVVLEGCVRVFLLLLNDFEYKTEDWSFVINPPFYTLLYSNEKETL